MNLFYCKDFELTNYLMEHKPSDVVTNVVKTEIIYSFCTSVCHSIFQSIPLISKTNFPASLIYMSYFSLLIQRREYQPEKNVINKKCHLCFSMKFRCRRMVANSLEICQFSKINLASFKISNPG